MSRIIQSGAFAGGFASVASLDEDEKWLAAQAGLVAWFGGSSWSLRSVDAIIDDMKVPNRTYFSVGDSETGARPSTGINGRPSIALPSPLATLRAPLFVLPASYTILCVAKPGAIGASQAIAGHRQAGTNRMFFGLQPTGQIELSHGTTSLNRTVSASHPPAEAGQPFIAWARYNAATNLADAALNRVATGGTVAFVDDHQGGANFSFGSFNSGNNAPFQGDLGEVMILDAPHAADSLRRAIRYLSRKWAIIIPDLS